MNLTENLQYSDYRKVRIGIDSAYKWGQGWTHQDAEVFHVQVINGLFDAGFTIKSEKHSGSSPSIIGKNQFDPTYLYLHPMEFTGYMKTEDVKKVLEVLNSCDCVSVYKTELGDVYELSDVEYGKILAKHSAEILNFVRSYNDEHGNLYECGLDFIKKYRIPRVGDTNGVISSSDFECIWIDNFINILKNLKMF